MTASSTQTDTTLLPPASAAHVAEPNGEAFIWQPRPGVVVEKASGILELSHARLFGDFYASVLVPGARVEIFVDLEDLTNDTREAREFLSAFTLEHRESIEGIHFLFSAKELALGISAYKHLIGDTMVHTYFDRASFVQSYEAAIRRP
jgi:hypothetical protein